MRQQNFEVFQTARRLYGIGLKIGNKTLPIFDFAKRMNHENRSVLIVECVTSLAESSIGNYAFDVSYSERHRIESCAAGSIMTSLLRWKPFSQVSTGPKITGQAAPTLTESNRPRRV